MPIAATQSALQAQIKNAFSLDKAASPDLKATTITSAIASVAPSGLYPPSPTPAPLIPSGFSACQSLMKNAFSLDKAASPDLVGKMFAQAVSLLVPTVPPAGQSLLAMQTKQAFSLDKAASPDLVATSLSGAIIAYYSMAGVV